MNKAYETMRGFWLDVNNLQHKKEVPLLGDKKICVAGVEMAAQDPKGGIKNVLIAASSLGNASVYFENNSPSGLGGFTGGAASGPVRDKALRLMQAAAKSGAFCLRRRWTAFCPRAAGGRGAPAATSAVRIFCLYPAVIGGFPHRTGESRRCRAASGRRAACRAQGGPSAGRPQTRGKIISHETLQNQRI